MGITKRRTSPYHPQCNSQVEVKNKFIAIYLGDFCEGSTLNWESLIPAMAFACNTTVHRTIKTTPFMKTYGIKHRTPGFSSHQCYGEDFFSDLHQKFKLVHQLAAKHTEKAAKEYSKEHHKNAVIHDYREGGLVLMKIFDLKNKNSKLAEKWQGPYKVI
jgi:hypothetical protein